jgi:hypothetical protein
MEQRTRREHPMKRIAIVAAVVTAAAVVVPTATAQNRAQVKPQVTAQVVGIQVANVQRAQAAVSLQRHLVQVAQAKRVSVLRAQLR